MGGQYAVLVAIGARNDLFLSLRVAHTHSVVVDLFGNLPLLNVEYSHSEDARTVDCCAWQIGVTKEEVFLAVDVFYHWNFVASQFFGIELELSSVKIFGLIEL